MSRAQLAAKVAADKLEHPERCPERHCLWRTGDGSYCPRHRHPHAHAEHLREAREVEAHQERKHAQREPST